ncbi:MAG: hypothetical protein ACT4QC_13385 [Planctomycetaceae bacterium]
MRHRAQRQGQFAMSRALASRSAMAGLMLTACACSSISRPTASTSEDPFLDRGETRPSARAVAQATHAQKGARPLAERDAAVHRTSQAQVAQAAFEVPDGGSSRAIDGTIERTAAEARMPVACPACPSECAANCCEESGYYPDEYLCDGGDRELPVHYDRERMLGLETEDTVFEYRDEDGRRRVRPSHKVCIYAPRFASVTTFSAPIEDIGGGPPVEAFAAVQGAGMKNRQATVAQEQREGTERLVSRLRGSTLLTDVASDAIDRPTAPLIHDHTAVVVENVGFLKSGQLRKSESAWIERQALAAVVWTRDQNPVIVAETEGPHELRAEFNASELAGLENRFQGKSRLRIVKLADRDVALPGDVVTFTIRFDNIGDQPVSYVVLVDNLTPRLEYIDDSATLNLDGRLVTEDNGEGSLILRWELDLPLAGRTGGVATFRARVR